MRQEIGQLNMTVNFKETKEGRSEYGELRGEENGKMGQDGITDLREHLIKEAKPMRNVSAIRGVSRSNRGDK
jgi:hypothetical protein